MAEIHKLSVEKTLNKIRPTMQSNLEEAAFNGKHPAKTARGSFSVQAA